MRRLDYLEIHVAHTCNLFCSSCSHYSQHHVGGLVSLEQAQNWGELWNQRLIPHEIALLGGEPTLHPQLPEFIETIHRAWPESKIILKTNGFFLRRHKRLREVLNETNTTVELNCHSDLPDYLSKYRDILVHVQDWIEIPLILKNSFGGKVHKSWTQRYFGMGENMLPFNDQAPQKSWELCTARDCLTLFEGRLWKCPPIAYLRLLPKTFNLQSDWDPYLAYQGLGPDCSDKELEEFLNRKAEAICGMCPSKAILYDKGNPLQNPRSV
ncbi:radical SAM protein [bacterium]|nr:radical SAM protein [bacterium]